MKGVVFNILEDIFTEHFGPDTWDVVLDEAGLDGAYTSLGNYDDDELSAIVQVASKALAMSVDDVLLFAGRHAFPALAARYPEYPGGMTSSRDIFRRLNDVIHPQVLALYPGAHPPEFVAQDRSTNELVLTYRSERRLCRFAEGLATGAVHAFGERASVAQEACLLDGADACRIVVDYGAAGDS